MNEIPRMEFRSSHDWKTHIDKIIPKLSKTCYVIRFVLSVVYFLNYVSFWGNSQFSKKVLHIQKKYMNCARVTK